MGLGDHFREYNENLNLNAYAQLCAFEDLVILLAQVLNNGPIMNNLRMGLCLIDIYQNLI